MTRLRLAFMGWRCLGRNRRKLDGAGVMMIVIGVVLGMLPGLHSLAIAEQGQLEHGLTWQRLTSKEGLIHNKVNAIHVYNDELFIGTDQGLSIFSEATATFKSKTTKKGLPHNRVLCFFQHQDQLIIGTEKGLAGLKRQDDNYEIHSLGLDEFSVQSLAQGGPQSDVLLVGSNGGLFFFYLDGKQPQRHQGLGAVSITDMAATQDGVLVLKENGQVVKLIWKDNEMKVLEIKANPLQRKVKALMVSGDDYWFATDGRGLINYNVYQNTWASPSDEKSSGIMLSTVMADGQYVWSGAFHGLFQYDQINKKWKSYISQPFENHSITSLTIDGHLLWVGTDGGGLIRVDKKYPTIRTYFTQRQVKNDVVRFTGQVKGNDDLKVSCEYTNQMIDDIWFKQYLNMKQKNNTFSGTIDCSKLLDGFYYLKINVADPKGYQNNGLYTFIKTTQPTSLTFSDVSYRVGKNIVSGQVNHQGIKTIRLDPGQVLADLDKARLHFVAPVNLTQSDRIIKATVIDLNDKQVVFSKTISVQPKPLLTITANKSSFDSGDETINFAIKAERLDELASWQFELMDNDGNTIYQNTSTGELVTSFNWDGYDQDGNVAPPGRLFKYSLKVKAKSGLEIQAPIKTLRSNLQVVKKEEGLVINIDNAFLFDSGQAKLREKQNFIFDELAELLKDHKNTMIMVEGHTDNRPINTKEFPSNTVLSKARAENVVKEIIKRMKISKQRLTSVGYGETKPIASNQTAIGRAKNRRVEIILVVTK